MCAENRGSNTAQSASIGLFSARRAAGKNSIQKACTERYHATRLSRTRNGWRDPCLQQENAYPSSAAQDSTLRAEGCAQRPFSTRRRAATIIIRCSGYNLRIFCRKRSWQTAVPVLCAGGRNSCRSSENRTAPRIRKLPTAPATVRRNGTGPRSERQLPAAPVKMKSAFCLSQYPPFCRSSVVQYNRMFAERAFYCIANGAGEQ